MDWIFVIVRAIPLYTTFYIVSIHLMLLFIHPWKDGPAGIQSFQYISCYSLSGLRKGIYQRCPAFQYISCYSLSKKMSFEIAKKMVFQYISCYSLSLRSKDINPNRFKFQYISCYSLSVEELKRGNGFPEFQYISYYSLSVLHPPQIVEQLVSIHLMLLFISEAPDVCDERMVVSIHLMLLFISL